MSNQKMKGITCCGECGDYSWKENRCMRGATNEINASNPFFDDCPLPDVSASAHKWIPCSERLPEEKGCYLCFWRSENHPDGATDVFNFDGKKFPWETVFLHQNNKVIAWMPLPEPYREEKKDE